jgi:hypothetical protein
MPAIFSNEYFGVEIRHGDLMAALSVASMSNAFAVFASKALSLYGL